MDTLIIHTYKWVYTKRSWDLDPLSSPWFWMDLVLNGLGLSMVWPTRWMVRITRIWVDGRRPFGTHSLIILMCLMRRIGKFEKGRGVILSSFMSWSTGGGTMHPAGKIEIDPLFLLFLFADSDLWRLTVDAQSIAHVHAFPAINYQGTSQRLGSGFPLL